MIHRTRFVTFPRSGHHWLISMLDRKFGEELRYEEFHRTGLTLENSDCNAQKNHDFDLSLPFDSGIKHVVQIRNFYSAAISWHKVDAWAQENSIPFNEFLKAKLPYYRGFLDKWVFGDLPNRIIVCYDQLLRFPYATVERVALFMTQ